MPHQIGLRSLALVSAAFSVLTANNAVAQIDPKAVVYQTPDQFKWRDPATRPRPTRRSWSAIQTSKACISISTLLSRTASGTRTITPTIVTSW